MLAHYRQHIVKYTEPLATWQKLYFLSFVILIYELLFGANVLQAYHIGFFALAALSVEMWPKFVDFWESLLGRVIVIVSYVIVGNFVVAFAGHRLNEVVGVDPSSLFYATSFVSIVTAPIWIITLTLIVMFCYMLFRNIWFLITLLPWLLGLYEKSNGQAIALPKITRAVRICMVPFMFIFLVSVLDMYNEEPASAEGVATAFLGGVKEGLQRKELEEAEQADLANVSERLESEEAVQLDSAITEQSALLQASTTEENLEQAKATESESKAKDKSAKKEGIEVGVNGLSIGSEVTLEKAIASFVYYVEAYAYSHCEKTERERLVSLGEYDVLAVEEDDSELGYRFTVRPCKLKTYSN